MGHPIFEAEYRRAAAKHDGSLKHTVKLTYKVSEFIEVEAPTHIDAVVKAGQMLVRGEIRPSGHGELQPESAYIEMPHDKVPNCT